ncbi:MAG: nitronate monooxygenase [Chloroflexi bacterium]|nr:nitronate monooxygenase [Chloroflexota bacterium]
MSGNHSGGRLAAAVSEAGGLGSFGAINPFREPDWVREQIRYIRSQTDRPFAVGYITHFIPVFPQYFETALEEKPPVIAFSFADPQPWLARAKEAGSRAVCQVQSMEGARQAVAAGADVLVAQGNEAGGHTGTWNLLPFLTRVVEAFPEVPVMAAGGIASGRALAAVLAAGGDGAWVGTAFLATPEAEEIPDAYKELIVRSDGEDTIYTEVFDIAASLPWPPGVAARAYRNRFAHEWHGREEELRRRLDEVAPAYLQAAERQDFETNVAYMGQSAASVEAVRPAAEVLRDICDEAERILRERPRELLG